MSPRLSNTQTRLFRHLSVRPVHVLRFYLETFRSGIFSNLRVSAAALLHAAEFAPQQSESLSEGSRDSVHLIPRGTFTGFWSRCWTGQTGGF